MEFISARTKEAGGGVTAVMPTAFGPRSNRLIVLVHGYNVNAENGRNGFNTFGQLLQRRGVSELSLLGQVVGFLWPGDENIKVIGGLFYPGKIGPAQDSAARLARCLVGLRGPNGAPLQIIVVAHSLGNRVALEMINDLLNQPNHSWGRMEGMCLMAAAVGVNMADSGGRLSVAARSLRTRNLFSKEDNVLHWAFPPGETAAGEGFFPQAIGRFGNPLPVWSDRFDMQPYDHGDYFTGLGTNDQSAQRVAEFLGASVPNTTPVSQISSSQLASPNEIQSRRLNN